MYGTNYNIVLKGRQFRQIATDANLYANAFFFNSLNCLLNATFNSEPTDIVLTLSWTFLLNYTPAKIFSN